MKKIIITAATILALSTPVLAQDQPQPPPKKTAEQELLELKMRNLDLEYQLLQRRLPEITKEYTDLKKQLEQKAPEQKPADQPKPEAKKK